MKPKPPKVLPVKRPKKPLPKFSRVRVGDYSTVARIAADHTASLPKFDLAATAKAAMQSIANKQRAKTADIADSL